MKDDLEMPSFLKRTETEAQAEKRRAKQTPKNDSKGLKVITPPDPKISAAIAKDFAEKKKTEKLETAKTAIEQINEARKKDGLRPYNAGKTVPPKKAGSLVAKALKERDALREQAKLAAAEKPAAKSAPKQKTAKRKTAKSATKKTDSKPRAGTIAAKMFTDDKVKTAKKLIERKGGALSSEIQKACSWKPIIVRRFVRDIARKRLGMSVICDRSTGHDSTYKL